MDTSSEAGKTFVRIVEYWVPNAQGNLLEFGGGLFGKAASFASITRRLCFGRGEGLPGLGAEAGHLAIVIGRASGMGCV